MAVKKIPISFKVSEEAIHDFIIGKRNYSCYIKDLVEADMNSSNAATTKNQLKPKVKDNNGFNLDF